MFLSSALLFPSQTGSKSSGSNFLSSKIENNSFAKDLVSQVKVARDFSQALELRMSLRDGESLVTKDGVWLGKNWIRISKDEKNSGTILQRQKELVSILEEFQ